MNYQISYTSRMLDEIKNKKISYSLNENVDFSGLGEFQDITKFMLKYNCINSQSVIKLLNTLQPNFINLVGTFMYNDAIENLKNNKTNLYFLPDILNWLATRNPTINLEPIKYNRLEFILNQFNTKKEG